MEFGIFSNGFRPHTTAAQTYEEDLAEIVLADQARLSAIAFISEHHGEPVYIDKVDTLPVPELLMCKAAAVTKHIRMGRRRQAHSPASSGRYRDPGRGRRSCHRWRPFYFRLRLRLSEPAVRGRARPVLRGPSRAAARIARSHSQMLGREGAVRLGRQVLARQGHRRHAAAAERAAYADGDGNRHASNDRSRRRRAAIPCSERSSSRPDRSGKIADRYMRAAKAARSARPARTMSRWPATSISPTPAARRWTIYAPTSITSSPIRSSAG